MKVHFCGEPGCHQIIPFDQRYCSQHADKHKNDYRSTSRRQRLARQRLYNLHDRDQQANSFYHSKQWRSVREYVVNRDLYTDAIDGNVIADHDLIVDHIVRRDLCDDALDPVNLWCLSRRHHWIKTTLEERMLSTSNGKNKLRHISKQNWIKYIENYEQRHDRKAKR